MGITPRGFAGHVAALPDPRVDDLRPSRFRLGALRGARRRQRRFPGGARGVLRAGGAVGISAGELTSPSSRLYFCGISRSYEFVHRVRDPELFRRATHQSIPMSLRGGRRGWRLEAVTESGHVRLVLRECATNKRLAFDGEGATLDAARVPGVSGAHSRNRG